MRFRWVDNYAGTWHDDEGRTLVIEICDEEHARVDLLVNGKPMLRPWCHDDPALGLAARYSPIGGPGLGIDLGRPGFCLDVDHGPVEPPTDLRASLWEYADTNPTWRRRNSASCSGN